MSNLYLMSRSHKQTALKIVLCVIIDMGMNKLFQIQIKICMHDRLKDVMISKTGQVAAWPLNKAKRLLPLSARKNFKKAIERD